MKIQAYVAVFNEADILPHTLRHLYGQGCAVHVLDGWSTDGSWEMVGPNRPGMDLYGVTSERFPAAGPDPIQRHAVILHRIEDLAAESDADWCLYSDADEWRRSPIASETLAQGVARVDAAGHNAIDFRVFQFYCIDGCWGRKMQNSGLAVPSPEHYFRNYDQADCISRIPNRKLWKNTGRVTLGGGGHEVTFPGMRVAPSRFVMKHYPFRTPQQARAKVETRLARRCAEEHARGWGSHYDRYVEQNLTYCWDPAKLLFWKDTRSPLP